MSWEVKRLGDVAQVVRGVTYQKPALLSQGHPDGIPLLRATNVQDRYVDYEEPVTVPRSLVKDNQFLQFGDILIASSSGSESVVGKSAKVVESTPATFGAFCTLLRATSIDPDFLAYFVSSTALRQRWRASARGSNINNLKASEIAQTEVPVPPLDEQKRIVAQLEDQLGKLEAVRTQRATSKVQLEQLRATALNQYFSSRTERMSVEALPLENVADVVMGQSPPGSAYNSDGKGLPFFQGKAEFTDLYPEVRKWTTEGSRTAEAGDILLSVRAPVGATNIANQTCVIGRGLAAIRAKERLDQRYLLLYLKATEEDLKAQGVGTTFDAITGKVLRQFQVPIPSLDEQRRIVQEFDEIQGSLDVIGSRLSEADGLVDSARSSILHRAFSAPEEGV